MVDLRRKPRRCAETAKRRYGHEHDHHQGWRPNLLQGLGRGTGGHLSHGWPLNADAWDGQMLFLARNGFRVVAHDRRGHGRSETAHCNDMDGYADDLACVMDALDLKDAAMVGHSTGGGEVARYIGRHGTSRVAKAVLIASIPPVMLKSEPILTACRWRCSTACAPAC